MDSWLGRLSDRTLALACAALIFGLCAWPLLLVDVPPFQDVPNHLAVSTIIDHPADYPDFVFTGFLKTNAALYAWDHFVGHAVGAYVAIRLFTAIVFATSAFAFARLLLVLGDRKKLLVGCLFVAPMVHNWCVALGLLDFALGFPITLLILAEMILQRRAPTSARAALIALLSVLAWYAHVIPLFLLHVVIFIELVVTAFRSWAEAKRFFATCVLPLLPGTALMTMSVLVQLTSPAPVKMEAHPNIWLAPWDLAYNLWAEWFWGAFTHLSLPTIVPCVVLAWLGWSRRKERVQFFEPAAFAVLAVMYAVIPYVLGYWAYANTRVAPLLWVAALVRVPARLPRWLVVSLGACTLAYSVSLGIDYVRLNREQKELTAGIPHVPEHARLLPLVFEPKGMSINTRPLLQAWGFYVHEKETAAPLVFASSRLYGVTYREPPAPQLAHVALEKFAGQMRNPKWLCTTLVEGGVNVGDCTATWRDYWRAFWALVEPRFDWLLLWDPEPITETVIPPEYEVVFRRGRLVIMHRP